MASTVINDPGTDCRDNANRRLTVVVAVSVAANLRMNMAIRIAAIGFGAINFTPRPVLHPVNPVCLATTHEAVPSGMLADNLNLPLISAQFPQLLPVDGAGSNPLVDPVMLPCLSLNDGSGGKRGSAPNYHDTKHHSRDQTSFFHDLPPQLLDGCSLPFMTSSEAIGLHHQCQSFRWNASARMRRDLRPAACGRLPIAKTGAIC
jgi:hypothetical protein